MLTAAYMGYMTNVMSGNLILAVIVAVLSGGLMALLHAWLSIHFKVDQIISGTVINILAVGLTGYFYQPGTVTKGKLQSVEVPLLADIPIVGDVFFDNGPLTYAAVVLVFVVNVILFRTRWGLRMRAVGEHPRAADTLGIDVFRMRYTNVVIGGMLAGLGGAYLTLEAVGSFERMMTNGRGFISLAAMIFGKWTPFGGWAAALLFGAANAVQTQIQFSGNVTIPHQFIGMLPYLLTVVVLAGFGGRARPPAAIGRPYEIE